MIRNINVGINLIFIKDGKVLLGKRLVKAGYGQWGLPGGHLEEKESFEECAKRETMEETGMVLEELEFANMINQPRLDEHYIQINYLAKKWQGEPKVTEPDRCEKWEWFDLNNLPDNIFFGHKDILPAFKEKRLLKDA